jgi:hypothetical protein
MRAFWHPGESTGVHRGRPTGSKPHSAATLTYCSASDEPAIFRDPRRDVLFEVDRHVVRNDDLVTRGVDRESATQPDLATDCLPRRLPAISPFAGLGIALSTQRFEFGLEPCERFFVLARLLELLDLSFECCNPFGVLAIPASFRVRAGFLAWNRRRTARRPSRAGG